MSAGTVSRFESHLTLILCMMLHSFTHAYASMLVPLYLPMKDSLKLPGVSSASLIVSIYIFVYCLASYPAGVLADRFNRKALLGIGLILNAIAILLMGLTHHYAMFLVLGVAAGLAGTLFHPAANALSTAHYPKSPGMAIGILSMGSAMGFFIGPRYAGWRADSAGWQAPLVEAGFFGIVFGVVFLLVAKETRKPPASSLPLPLGEGRGEGGLLPSEGANGDSATRPIISYRSKEEDQDEHPPLDPKLRNCMIAVALVLAGRDFTGVASISLASIYLQKAEGMSVGHAGLIIGSMMLIAIIVNPLAVYLSPGRRRLPTLAIMLIVGGAIIATVPWTPVAYILPVLCAFQACHLGSYAVSEAAMLERVSAAVRGRVIGIFITIAGTIAALAPWLMGHSIDAMGSRASEPRAYVPLFGGLCVLHTCAAASVFLIRRLSESPISEPVSPLSEITPATLEVAG